MKKVMNICTIIIILSILLYCIVFQLYKNILRWKTLNWPIMAIFGHRGAIIRCITENRIPAFQFAMDNNVFGLELDTRLTKDNHLVVLHDATIQNKTTGEYQEIHLHTLSELQSISEPKIQSLHEIFLWLETTTTHNYPLNIEIKMDKITSISDKQRAAFILLETIQLYRPLFYNITIQCFDIELLREIRNITDQPVTSVLVETQNELESLINTQQLSILDADILSPHFSLVDKSLVLKMHKQGVKVLPWTVNSSITFNKLREMGVDGVITDYPHLFVSI